VTIRKIIRKTDTLGNAFLFNSASLTGVSIPDSSRIYVPVRFQPTQKGKHILVIEFDNTGSQNPLDFPRTTLLGIGVDSITGVQDSKVNKEKIRNFRVYPNPFESGTTFSFDSEISGNSVDIEIYDILGSKITTINSIISEGENRINWNGRDRSGSKLKSGVYFARLKNTAVYSSLSLLLIIQ
ncbi:MAG: T9SS type A sorting domain-containing protein, partial [Bacteroidota bacterium]